MVSRTLLIIGLSMLIWAAWFNYASDAPTTTQEMELVCARDAVLNNTTPEYKNYISQCVEDTGKSVAVLAMIWVLVIFLGLLITVISFWRIRKNTSHKSNIDRNE